VTAAGRPHPRDHLPGAQRVAGPGMGEAGEGCPFHHRRSGSRCAAGPGRGRRL